VTKAIRGRLLVVHVLNPMLPIMSAQPNEPPTYAPLRQISRS
jgi:hypothetical protein